MLFGINDESLSELKSATDGVTAERLYFTPSDGVPESWPPVPGGLTGVVSFRPDLESTADGKLDNGIVGFLRTAPAYSWVTIWHEGNAPRFHFDPATFKAACGHVLNLVKANNIPVRFGQILETYPVQFQGQKLAPWIALGCSFYGLDGYQEFAADTVDSVFYESFDQIVTATGKGHAVTITETNSHFDVDTWAQKAMSYAHHFLQGPGFLWYASQLHGGYPGMPSAAVLQNIAREAASS